MKPPGGESHDLFGAAFNGSPSHLRVLKPPGGVSSDIFGANGEQMMEARRNKNLNQTSTLFLGGHDDDHHSKGSCKSDGNPVTGEGYDAAPLKPQTAQTLSGGTTPSTPNSSTGSAAPRQRVPPGGFSSGLW